MKLEFISAFLCSTSKTILLPHRKYMRKSLIGCKCYAKHLNKKILKYVKEYYK